jgi:hypothetical protein
MPTPTGLETIFGGKDAAGQQHAVDGRQEAADVLNSMFRLDLLSVFNTEEDDFSFNQVKEPLQKRTLYALLQWMGIKGRVLLHGVAPVIRGGKPALVNVRSPATEAANA